MTTPPNKPKSPVIKKGDHFIHNNKEMISTGRVAIRRDAAGEEQGRMYEVSPADSLPGDSFNVWVPIKDLFFIESV